MRGSEMLETAGLPTFYVTHVVAEPADGRNVRIWNCTERHGVLIPNCEIIIPAMRLVLCAKRVTECALEVYNTAVLKETGVIHH